MYICIEKLNEELFFILECLFTIHSFKKWKEWNGSYNWRSRTGKRNKEMCTLINMNQIFWDNCTRHKIWVQTKIFHPFYNWIFLTFCLHHYPWKLPKRFYCMCVRSFWIYKWDNYLHWYEAIWDDTKSKAIRVYTQSGQYHTIVEIFKGLLS